MRLSEDMAKIFTLIFLGSFINGAFGQTNEITTSDGYRLKYFERKLNYDEAYQNCSAMGETLAIIKTEMMGSNVQQVVTSAGNTEVYIGLTRPGEQWAWNDGTFLEGEANWCADTECFNATSDGDCAILQKPGGKWNKVDCSAEKHHVCQYELVTVTPDKEEVLAVECEPMAAILRVHVVSYNGPVNVSIYKLPDLSDSLQIFENVYDEDVQYRINNPAESDAASYEFVASKQEANPYSRGAIIKLTVHVAAKITEASPSMIRSPVTKGPDSVTCTTHGIPTPYTTWMRNDVEILSTERDGVYQQKTNESAILFIENAQLSEAGIYACYAENDIGESPSTTKTDSEEITLSVLGSPNITGHEVGECTEVGKVTLIWKSNDQTTGIIHRIHATDSNETESIHENVTSSGLEQTTVIENLKPFSDYTITVSVCPDECIEKLNDTISVKTGVGVPLPVTDAAVRNNGEYQTCTITWQWEDELPVDDVSFEIHEYSTLVVTSGSTAMGPSEADHSYDGSSLKPFQADIETQPNTDYEFTVTAKTCAGRSTGVKAVGNCTFDTAAPDEVEVPMVLPSEGTNTRTINLTVPDESNGPVSCLFVIMKSGKEDIATNEFSENDLAEVSDNAFGEMKPSGIEYLTAAVKRSEIDGTVYNVSLGNGANSSCDIDTVTTTKNTQRVNWNGVYSARNWDLTNDEKYTYYIVTTTPSKTSGVLFQQSETSSFVQIYDPIPPAGDDSNPWIIGAVLGPILLVAIVILAIYYIKRKSKKASDYESETLPTPAPRVSGYDNRTEQVNLVQNSPTTIPLIKLKTVFEEFNAEDGEKFKNQYLEIKENSQTIFATDMASRETVRKKNRYKNVLPYDKYRVKLSGEDTDTYINASYIYGYSKANKFIATQGPLVETIDDFWRMVVEQRSRVIVMLTNTIEAGKSKCQQYWPDIGCERQSGYVTIMNIQEEVFGGYTKRTFEVSRPGSSPMEIEQFQFVLWPDHGVPVTSSNFVRFYKACVTSQGSDESPMIVHCSAGAGRTGTFIGYNYLLDESKTGGIDVYECVTKMRQQRMDMVQASDQYKLLHRLMLEAILFHDTDMDASELKQKLKDDEKSKTRGSLIQKEYKNLGIAASVSKIGEKDSRAIILWQPGDDNSIPTYNAYRIETYAGTRTVIAAEEPGLPNMDLFWRVVIDNKVGTIVMLDTPAASGEVKQEYWPSKTGGILELGPVSVECKNVRNMKHAARRGFTVRRSKQEDEVKQYQILHWTPDDILGLLSEILKTPRKKKDSAILVHCSDGLGRTGVFCTLMNLMRRFKVEQLVDVFRAVKDLQDCRPGMVQTLDEYKLCYRTMALFTESAKTYEWASSEDQNNPAYENITSHL